LFRHLVQGKNDLRVRATKRRGKKGRFLGGDRHDCGSPGKRGKKGGREKKKVAMPDQIGKGKAFNVCGIF